MLVVFIPSTKVVTRIIIPGPGEPIEASHIRSGEAWKLVPLEPRFADPFNHDAFAAGLALHGLVFP